MRCLPAVCPPFRGNPTNPSFLSTLSSFLSNPFSVLVPRSRALERDWFGLDLGRPEARVEVGEEDVALPRHCIHDEGRIRSEALGIVRLEDCDLALLIRQIAQQRS